MISESKYKKYILGLLVLVGICISQFGAAQVSYEGKPVGYFGTQVTYLESNASLNHRQAMARLDSFNAISSDVLNLGVSQRHHWLYFKVVNQTDHDSLNLRLDYPVIDDVSFYVFDEKGLLLDSVITGEKYPFAARGNNLQDFVFKLPFQASHEVQVLLRIESGEQIMVPLRIQSDRELLQSLISEHIYFGIYIGLILVMLFYNFFVYLSIRDRAYLLYVIYIFIIGLTQTVLHGFAFKMLWPNIPYLAVNSVYIVGAGSGVAVLLFVREYLKIREKSKSFDNYLLALGFSDVFALSIAFFGQFNLAYSIINVMAALGSLSILIVAIYFARKGQRSARFFLLAWSIFLLSVVLFVFRDVGILPYNRFTENILLLGSGIEVVLLSFALADRINILKRESEYARLRELDALKVNERLVKEQNVILEQKVDERTLELSDANKQLNNALEDLKHAQVQLVNAEKMASLGQLTAGIAHEINNPINFVAASIEPLQRDLKDIKTMIERYQDLIDQCANAEGKVKAVEIRNELDYDFTIQEIDELLLGVDEGARRTAEIVLGLKNFSRLDESESKMSNVHECLNSTLIVLRNITKDHVEVNKEFDPNMQDIECFPGKLNQVFSNIIVNAVQAIDELPNPRVNIATKFLGDTVEIRISDNGPGIPENIRQKIFEPFFTTKDVGLGTGLGLSIVYSIIEQHQGEIRLNDEVEIGTEFVIVLPVRLKE